MGTLIVENVTNSNVSEKELGVISAVKNYRTDMNELVKSILIEGLKHADKLEAMDEEYLWMLPLANKMLDMFNEMMDLAVMQSEINHVNGEQIRALESKLNAVEEHVAEVRSNDTTIISKLDDLKTEVKKRSKEN